MNPGDLHDLLRAVKDGRVTPEEAAERLRALPYEDLGFAKLDHHRALRRGAPEVVYGGGKTPEQVATIVERMAAAGHNVLVTRASTDARDAVLARGLAVAYHESARCLTLAVREGELLPGRVAVVSRRHLGPAGRGGGGSHRRRSSARRSTGTSTSASRDSIGCSTVRSRSVEPASSSWSRGWRVPCLRWWAAWSRLR